jgi:multimeric flavodoxin WrbA
MKILAINGSHTGKRGLTQSLIDQIQAGAVAAGAEFETIVLAEAKINQCLGCEICHTERSYLKCVYDDKDDMKIILQKISKSDIIIYATPIHIFNMSGLMKKFLDRFNSTGDISKILVSKKGLFFHHIDADICSKPFALLITCGNIEDETPKNVISYFETFSKFMDAPMIGVLVRKSSFLFKKMNEKTSHKKATVLKAFQEAGKELAIMKKISAKTQKLASLNILEIPFITRMLMKIRPLKSRLIEKGLIRLK